MSHANRMASLALLTLAASLLTAGPARADGISSYRIVDLGYLHSNQAIDGSIPNIDESGNLVGPGGRGRSTGIYQLGVVTEPGAPSITTSYYLHANGGGVNLLPTAMQNPNTGDARWLNALGQTLGNIGDQPVIFLAAPGQIVDPKWLAGDTQAPYLASINNLGQIVGDGSQPILYDSPTAVPIALTDLLPVNSGWKLLTASDINALGEIVGTGVNPAGQVTDYELVPMTAPEPTTWMIFSIGALLYGGFRIRTRALRPRVQAEMITE